MKMDRRKFIKTAGLAAGATLLSEIGLAGVTIEKTKSMKIVVLTGSPRLNGNTNYMASQFMKGAEEAGHKVSASIAQGIKWQAASVATPVA